MRSVGVMLTLFAVGCSCSDAGLSAIQNEAPEATILSHEDGDEVVEGYTVELVGSVIDDRDLVDAVATFNADGEEVCSTGVDDAGLVECDWLVPDAGEVRVRLDVTDSDGATVSENIDLEVLVNTAPSAAISLPQETGAYFSNIDVPLEGVGVDLEGSPTELTAVWSSNVDGELGTVTPDSSGNANTAAPLTQGAHTITLTVTDPGNLSGTDTVDITVGPPNSPPDCEIVAPDDGHAVGAGNTITFQGLVADADQEPETIEISWASDMDGQISTAAPDLSGFTTFERSSLTQAVHQITLTATDAAGLDCTDSVSVEVTTTPSAAVVHIEPQNPESADDLVCIMDYPAVDAEGDPLTYYVEWLRDGVLHTETETTTITDDTVESGHTSPGQIWQCNMYATDGVATSLPGQDQVTVENPSATWVTTDAHHACQLDTNNLTTCWGNPDHSVLDLHGGLLLDVDAGDNHTCGIDLNGDMACVGLSNFNQTDTSGLVGPFVQADAGDAHTCAVDSFGGIQCWGNDDNGQADPSGATNTYSEVGCSFRHCCAVATDNTMDCWGADTYDRTTPPPLVEWDRVAAGTYHTCGLDTGGAIKCFGRNHFGQSSPPVGSETYIAIATAELFSCAIQASDGAVVCWGDQTLAGQTNAPPSGVFIALDAAGDSACAVNDAGLTECWGTDTHGESFPPTEWW